MFKALILTAILSLTASGIETLSTFVDEVPRLAGIPDAVFEDIGTEFPLTEEDTIKLQNRYSVILLQQQREQEKQERYKTRQKEMRKKAAEERKAVALNEPIRLDIFTFYKSIFSPIVNGVPIEEQYNWNVAFVNPECKMCQILKPTWSELYMKYTMSSDPEMSKYKFAEVDCTSNFGWRICEELKIDSNPKMLFFPARAEGEPIMCDSTLGFSSPASSFEGHMLTHWENVGCHYVPEYMLPSKKSENKKKKDKSKKNQEKKLAQKKIRREQKQAQAVQEDCVDCIDEGAQVHAEL